MVGLLGQEAAQPEKFDEQFVGLLLFGGAALLFFGAIYLWQNGGRKGGLRLTRMNITFARLFALLVVAVLAVALAFADAVTDASKTAAFTLIGTIAGYLAGARPTDQSVPAGEPGADGAAVPGGAGAPEAALRAESVL